MIGRVGFFSQLFHLRRSTCTILLSSRLFRKLTQKQHIFPGSTYSNHNLEYHWEEDSILFILCWRDQGINCSNRVKHAEEVFANELFKISAGEVPNAKSFYHAIKSKPKVSKRKSEETALFYILSCFAPVLSKENKKSGSLCEIWLKGSCSLTLLS